ncbi:MAG: putative 2OG-Fe(II) oxygenase [Betaproteobacteria bacterium]
MKTALAQAQALIESGFACQQGGQTQQAQQAYEQALRLVPNHPTALQLLGLLARHGGNLQQAHDLLRRSLAVHPAQPHVWNNLANTLEDMGQPSAALSCLDQALQHQPDYAEAHYNRARLLLALGRAHEALPAIHRAMGPADAAPSVASPLSAKASHWQLLAQITDALQGPDAALRVLGHAQAKLGEHAALQHDQAVLLQRLAKHPQALACHDRAMALGLNQADAHYNRGNTLQSLGQLEQADAAYGQALSLAPLHRLAHYDLARLRWRQGRSDWLDALSHAIDHGGTAVDLPAKAVLLAMKAQLLWRRDELDGARLAYEAAWQLSGRAEDLDGMARCAVRLGDLDAGLALHQQALHGEPQNASLWASLCSSLLVAGRVDDALAPAQQAVALAPKDQMAWALLSTVYRKTHPDRALALLNQDLMAVEDLPTPDGFADMASFNQSLARELSELQRDRQAPVDQTLRGGTQTLGNLFDLDLPLVASLQGLITQALNQFVSRLRHESGHPLLGHRTGLWRYSDSWSSRLASEGRHTNHVHPHGWISAVYYVQVPAACADPLERPGWLAFGEPDPAMARGFSPWWSVQPRPGRLVLFPSYWWHGTRPFHSTEPRTTIAFDVVPTLPGENPQLHE